MPPPCNRSPPGSMPPASRSGMKPKSVADQRFVKDLISFDDPGGNHLEAFHGAAIAAEPFRPGRSISGFRTGALGMGHVVFHVKNIDDLLGFYKDLLGFGVSDYITTPFRAYFMHTNPRHHSVALIETGKQDLHHLMVELFSLDDVGQGYDIALGEPEKIATTLGRHPNDAVTSYYLRSPGGFMLEYGWGGKEVTPGDWTPSEVTVGPSLWGHDRAWLPEEQRQQARDDAPESGRRRQARAAACHRRQLPPHGRRLSLVGRGYRPGVGKARGSAPRPAKGRRPLEPRDWATAAVDGSGLRPHPPIDGIKRGATPFAGPGQPVARPGLPYRGSVLVPIRNWSTARAH